MCSCYSVTPVAYGVPQGSVLGTILFLLYVADLLKLIKHHQLSPQAHADHTQIYGFCQPSDVNALADSVSACFDAWMGTNRLQLNPSKTEVLWCASGRRQHQIPTSPVRIGSTYVLPLSSVRDLGVYGYISSIDSDVSLRTHVTATVTSCIAALRQIRSVRRCLPQHALLTLIRALVVSRVDYCCSVLAGVSGHLLNKLQSILNAGARLVFSARRSERITSLLCDLHWLRVPERIQFPICVLAFRCLNGSALPYLAESVRRTADVEGRRHLRSSTTSLLSSQCSDQHLVTVAFLSLHRGHGTAYHLPSELFYPLLPFGNN